MKNLFVGLAALGCGLASVQVAHAQLKPAERKGLEDALFIGGLTLEDIAFERGLTTGHMLTPFRSRVLRRPVEAVDDVMALHVGHGGDLGRNLRAALETLYPELNSQPVRLESGDFVVPPEVPAPYRDLVLAVAQAVARSSAQVRFSLAELSQDERRDLIESLPQMAAQPSNVKFDFVRRKPLDPAQIKSLIEKVKWPVMAASAVELAEAVESIIPRLQNLARESPFSGQIKFNVGKMVVVLAGNGSNDHVDRDAAVTIDLGGADTYRGRHGAGVGYSALHLDLGGDDAYDVPDLSLGAGVLGVGIALDLGGDDTFRTRSIALGSGLGGFGLFKKVGGHDWYRSDALSQGFGHFGAGMFVDSAGDDHHSILSHGQGCGLEGGFGRILDLNGGDIYVARAQPARAQGCGAQSLSNTGSLGGIGALSELSGDDLYVASSMAQAAGDGGGVGTVFDHSGADTYRVLSSGQAYAQTGGHAYLCDLDGGDAYVAHDGDVHAAANRHGFAFLLDRDGDDVYAGGNSRPGLAIDGALAVFLDANGGDRYAGPVGIGMRSQSSDAVGIFADLSGEDHYGIGLEDGDAAVSRSHGIAVDQESSRRPDVGPTTDPLDGAPTPGSIAKPSDQELAELFATALASQGRDQPKFGENLRRLVGIGLPAFHWMLDVRLPTAERPEYPIWALLLEALGPDARNALAFRITGDNDQISLRAILICEFAEVKEAGAAMIGALRKPALRRAAARASNVFPELGAVSELMVCCADQDKMTAVFALNALAKLGDPQTLGTGQALMASPDALIRKAAVRLVARFPEAALPSARVHIASADERLARAAIDLLGEMGTQEALKIAGDSLRDGRSGLRIQAMLALNGRCPIEHRPALLSLRSDPDPRVRWVANRIDPGR
jgi:hypothetical protein